MVVVAIVAPFEWRTAKETRAMSIIDFWLVAVVEIGFARIAPYHPIGSPIGSFNLLCSGWPFLRRVSLISIVKWASAEDCSSIKQDCSQLSQPSHPLVVSQLTSHSKDSSRKVMCLIRSSPSSTRQNERFHGNDNSNDRLAPQTSFRLFNVLRSIVAVTHAVFSMNPLSRFSLIGEASELEKHSLNRSSFLYVLRDFVLSHNLVMT